jgi:hypothetical protein
MGRESKKRATEVLAILSKISEFEPDADVDDDDETPDFQPISSTSTDTLSFSESSLSSSDEDEQFTSKSISTSGVPLGRGNGRQLITETSDPFAQSGRGRGIGRVRGRGIGRGRGLGLTRGRIAIDLADPYPNVDNTSKDQITWHKMSIGDKTSFRHNLAFNSECGPSSLARLRIDLSTLSSWRLLFDDFMIRKILRHEPNSAQQYSFFRKRPYSFLSNLPPWHRHLTK